MTLAQAVSIVVRLSDMGLHQHDELLAKFHDLDLFQEPVPECCDEDPPPSARTLLAEEDSNFLEGMRHGMIYGLCLAFGLRS